MNAKTLVAQYGLLTGPERFRLILAAGARHDDVEWDRLAQAGSVILQQLSDYQPFAQAFHLVSDMCYIEMLALAADYLEHLCMLKPKQPREDNPHLELVLARGYELRTMAKGWELFCQRQEVPPYFLWEHAPGYHRIQRALKVAGNMAFNSEGYLRWVNARRGKQNQLSECPMTVEAIAENNEHMFTSRV